MLALVVPEPPPGCTGASIMTGTPVVDTIASVFASVVEGADVEASAVMTWPLNNPAMVVETWQAAWPDRRAPSMLRGP